MAIKIIHNHIVCRNILPTGPGLMPDPHNWFLADSAVQRETCNSQNNALEFNNKKGE